MIHDTLAFAAQKISEGEKVALVTVTGTNGSSPASPGQMMAVLGDGTSKGTVGGGATEHRIIRQAVHAIQNGGSIFSFSFNHAENGMICGGSMEGFGNILGSQTSLCIFGGGHIAQSLAQFAVLAGFSVTIVEDRPEFASGFDSVKYIVCEPDDINTADPARTADYAVICTRGHKTDDVALRYCLTKQFKYIGMVGSKQKVSALFAGLKDEGATQPELDRIYTPIGLDIASTAPAEIAVAILAEILLIKNNGTPRHKRSGI